MPATPNSGGEGGGASVTTSEDPPAGASEGDMWWDSSDGADSNGGRLYLYYDGQWVQTSNVGGDGGGGGGGVEQLIAGNNITLTPADGKGVVTVNSTGGPGGVNYQGASAWGSVAANGTLEGGLNSTSTEVSTGTYRVTFLTPMSNDNYGVNTTTGGVGYAIGVKNKTINSFDVEIRKTVDGARDNQPFSFAVHSSNAIAPPSGVGADAWGIVRSTAGLINGFNVKAIGRVSGQAAGAYTVEFTTPMPTDDYAVVITPQNSNYFGGVSGVTKDGFEVYLRNSDNNNNLGNTVFYFTVHASSTVTPTYTWTRDGTTLKPANDGDDVEIAASVKTSYLDITANPIQTTGNLIKINGVSEGSTTIGYDGSATFASTVSIKGGVDSSSATNNGILINEIGTVGIQRSSTSSVSATSFYTYRGTTRTSAIKLNGDAEFAGKVTASNVTFSLESDNVANFSAEGEYTGPTLDVKELLLKLVTAADRIEALEETNASLEARLSALEGGSY